MSAAIEANNRVDAWLALHGPWLAASRTRSSLAHQWYTVAGLYGPTSGSAIGVLLALVREAWGACMDVEEFYTNTGTHQFEVSIHDSDGDPRTFRGESLASELTTALEAAPC